MPGKLHRVHIPGVGESLVHMGSGTPYTVDTKAKFPIGTILDMGDRKFVYSMAGGTCNPECGAYKVKVTNSVVVAPVQATAAAQAAAYPGETLAAGAAGGYYVTVTIDTEIGVLTTGVLSENELAGGYIVIGNGGGQHPQNRRIVSHPALTTTGGALTVKLDAPLFAAATYNSTTIEIMESPYYLLKADLVGSAYVSFVGVPTVVATTGEYFWLQNRGPCWVTSDTHTCDSAGDRTLVWASNGSVVSSNDITVESGMQIAGYALDGSSSGNSNAPFIMLQLD